MDGRAELLQYMGLNKMIGIVELFLLVPFVVLWIWMLIDCIKRPDDKFAIGGNYAKIIWIIVIIFTGMIGVLIYSVLIKKVKISILIIGIVILIIIILLIKSIAWIFR